MEEKKILEETAGTSAFVFLHVVLFSVPSKVPGRH